MFSCNVKRLSFRCQTFKFSHPNVKFYFSTPLKGKMVLINKKGRNYQKGVPLSTICRIKWKTLGRIILSQYFSEVGRRLGCSFKNRLALHFTFGRENFNVWHWKLRRLTSRENMFCASAFKGTCNRWYAIHEARLRGVLISHIAVIFWPNIKYPINSGHRYPGN